MDSTDRAAEQKPHQETPGETIARLTAEKAEQAQEIADLKAKLAAAEARAAKAENESGIDPLTGLPNRGEIEKQLKRRVAEVKRNPAERVVVLMIDVDSFKLVNDTYGHGRGDMVLKEIARMLVDSGRESDFFGRISGDEFVAILPVAADVKIAVVEEALQKFNQNARKINRSPDPEKSDFQTLSIGGVVIDSDTEATWEAVLAAADGNLYFSKETNRDRSTLTDFAAAHSK